MQKQPLQIPEARRPVSPPSPPPAYGAAAMVDMVDEINWSKCEVLNAKGGGGALGNCCKQGVRDQELILLESDADEQLLVTFSFKSKVKLHSILIAGPDDGRAPRTVKLFANRIGLGFDDAEDGTAEQVLEFEAGDDKFDTRQELKFVKFQNVDTVQLFVQSNVGDEDTSALSKVIFYGANVATTNMGNFKRVAGKVGESD